MFVDNDSLTARKSIVGCLRSTTYQGSSRYLRELILLHSAASVSEYQHCRLEDIINHHLDCASSSPSESLAFLPCALCTKSANLRVSLPTYSHTACTNCLAKFEVYQSPRAQISCIYCFTYWFEIESENEIKEFLFRKSYHKI